MVCSAWELRAIAGSGCGSLAGLRGVGGCGGVKSGLERVMVMGKRGAWFLRVACFRAGWLPLLAVLLAFVLPLLLGCLISQRLTR